MTLPSGQTQYNITGGTRPGGGTNLFHSFGDFSVPTNNIANFLNSSGLPTTNILGRITGGNPSSIFGMIQTNGPGGFSNANLFLMNPAGFLFGPNATLNVGGMVAFTTADYLRFQGNEILFNNTSTSESLGPLTITPVAAFGFLGSNPAAIAIQGSTLQVAQGQNLSLVGGNKGFTATNPDNGNPINVPDGMTMTGGKLLASGGHINIASVAGPGEISTVDFMPTSGMAMGNISLSQGALIDVSADAAGTVRIRGGQLVLADATISADTGNTNGTSTAIDISVTADLSITDSRGLAALTARTTGNGDAGAIQIDSANLTAGSTSTEIFSLIDTHTSGTGRAGNIQITTGNLQASYQGGGIVQLTDSGTAGPGHGGDITISADSVSIEGMGINSGDSMAAILGQTASGSAGNVAITASSINLLNSTIDTSAIQSFDGAEQAGSVTLNAHDINLTQAFVSGIGFGGGGSFTVTADSLIMDGGARLESLTASGPGGGILVNGRVVELRGGSQFATTTAGDGQAGDIHVTATGHLTLDTSPFNSNPSGFFSNSTGDLGSGNAGTIVVTTPTLNMTGGSRINTATLSSGHGGDVIINSPNSISISGEFPSSDPEPIFGIGTIHPSGIFTKTAGSDFCIGSCGDAGHISITTGSLILGSGAQIDSGTSNSGRGGKITVNATNQISMSGTLTDGSPVGIFSRAIGTAPDAGAGGNIELHAGQLQVTNGAQISASSLGAGNAGSVMIEGTASPAQSVLIDGAGSGIFTDTQGTGAGGSILLNANTVTLQDGGTLSATTSGTGNGGEIQVNAGTINLLGFASINTLSFLGDGSAGNIALKATQQLTATDSFLNSDAVEGTGHGGTILLSSPTIRLNGGVLSTSTAGTGNAGNILLEGQQISLGASPSAATQGADLFASTSSSGQGGTITLRGMGGSSSYAENVTIAGNSRLHTVTSADGSAGDITIRVARFALSDLSTLNADTFGSGRAGTITISATDSATISSAGSSVSSSSDFGATGNAGQITVAAPTVLIENGGLVSTSTTGEATGGNVNIAASNSVTMTNGAKISASSTGTGKAGNIAINAGNQFAMTSSSVTTEANQSSGGAIKITTNPNGTVQLTNSMISASVLDGNGGGGSVNIDPQFVILQNSQVLANAVFGPGGNIFITTNLLLPDSTSKITATSQFGQQGTITIQSPISPASGKIVPLGQRPLLPTSLLSQRCAALAGGNISSFTVAGRDSLPAEPGGWVSTPLALSMSEYENGIVREVDSTMSDETPLLSLRKIAPPGFLTQTFAQESAGCTS